MSTRIFESIVSRWDDKALNVPFPGGVWLGRSPKKETWPYVVMSDLGTTSDFWTSSSEFQSTRIQLTIWYRDSIQSDPSIEIGVLMRKLNDALRFAPLVVPSTEGYVLEMRPTREQTLPDDDDDRVWRSDIDYRVRRQKSVNYNPA